MCAHYAGVRLDQERGLVSVGPRFFIRLTLLWQKRAYRSFEVFRLEEPSVFGDIQVLVARLRSPAPKPPVQDNRRPFLQAVE
jgi:hypothetical protein